MSDPYDECDRPRCAYDRSSWGECAQKRCMCVCHVEQVIDLKAQP